jgi:hypothetical protein
MAFAEPSGYDINLGEPCHESAIASDCVYEACD